LNKPEGGYTLVELLVSLALMGVVFVIAGMAFYQLTTVSGFGNNRLTAWHELQNTNLWLNRDGQQALSSTLVGNVLTLNLSDNSVVTYRLNGTTLQRITGTHVMNLAHDVSAFALSIEDNLVTLNITASISGRTVENVQSSYQVFLCALQ
jgi:prepilin-type N-terminal cleavage/methylation domain-containing protein